MSNVCTRRLQPTRDYCEFRVQWLSSVISRWLKRCCLLIQNGVMEMFVKLVMCYCDSFTREEDCIQNLLCTQRTFGNYWAFAVFSGPDLIANLSDGLKIMDPGFITCDDIGKLLFIIFWKHLKQLFGHFNPLPLLLVSQQMWHPSNRNLSDFQMLLQNKVNR